MRNFSAKRVISFMLSVLMLLSLFPTSVFAEGQGQSAAVAKIGDTGYASLADAIAAVTDGTETTITMAADVGSSEAYAEYASVYVNTIASGKNIVLDLNGKQIYAKTTVDDETCYIRVENGAKLTIKDTVGNGAINYLDGNDNTGGFVICSAGDLVLNGGTLENKTNCVNSAIQGAVDVHANEWGTYYTADTTFTMTGGSLKSQGDNTLRLYDSSQTGSGKVNIKANISGGEITGKDAVFIMPAGTNAYDVNQEKTHYMNPISVNVTGGTFTTTNGIRVCGGVTVKNTGDAMISIAYTDGATFVTSDTEKYRVNGVAYQETAGWSSTEESTANLRSYVTVNGEPAFVESFFADANGVYHIANLAGLKAFRDEINNNQNEDVKAKYNGKTIVLDADIDLGNEAWTAINTTQSIDITFDGQGHTVRNFTVTGQKKVGFFGDAACDTIKNLTVENATVTGINHVAAIAGYGLCTHILNCTVKNAVVTTEVANNDDGDKAGAICGYLSGESTAEVTNCTVTGCTIRGYRDIGGAVGYANGTATVTGNTVTDTIVIGDRENNYKNYTTDAEFDVNEVVGEAVGTATVKDNTPTNVTVVDSDFCVDAEGVYHITNLAGLKAFRDKANTGALNGVNGGKHTKVVLEADIDLNNEEWTPINGSCIDFDGNGHTISNVYVSGTAKNVGLFGTFSICKIENLTVDGANVTGINHVAALCGDGLCTHILNCTVKNAAVTTKVTGNDDGDKAGAICGYLSGESTAEVTNCTVTGCTIRGYRDIGGAVGYANGTATVTGNTVTDTTVINDQENNYKNYATDAEFDVNKVVGEAVSKATVNSNTAGNDVTVVVANKKVVVKDETSGEDKTASVTETEKKAEVTAAADNATDATKDYAETLQSKTTTVSGVTLTDVPTVENATKTGMQAVVDAAKEAVENDSDKTTAIESATKIQIDIQVAVTPVDVQKEAGETSSVTISLDPTATVTAVTGTTTTTIAENIPVTNDMIDQTKKISVSFYTGFEPAQIIHTDDDGNIIEVFTGSQIAYDETTKVATVQISHFSDLTAINEPQVASITKSGKATTYATLAEALLAAESGDTIEVLAGTWGADEIGTLTIPEKGTVRYKSLTIKPAAGAKVTFTADVDLGYDDSSTANATMSVSGFAFENATLTVSNYVNATVENCTFDGGSSSAGTLIVMNACAEGHKTTEAYPASSVTIKNCSIDGSVDNAPGMRIRDCGNVTVTGNTIKNTNGNGILFEASKPDNSAAVAVSVTDNTITEWNATNKAEGGRAMRLAFGDLGLVSGSTVTINDNYFTKADAGLSLDTPDFVKITGATNATVNLNRNSWNDEVKANVSGKSAIYTVDGATPAVASVISTKAVYVAQVGKDKFETLAEAVEAAADGDTITLLADVALGAQSGTTVFTINNNITLNMNGKTITCNGKSGYSDVKLFAVTADKTFNVIGAGCIDITETNNYGYVFDNKGTVNVTPGENNTLLVKAGYRVFNSYGTRNIVGGKFWQYSYPTELSSIIDQDNYEMITEEISGKTFYVVKALNVICKVNNVEYKRISAAMKASKVDNVITNSIVLTADAAYTGDITENYTFEGNYTLTVSGKIKAGTYDCTVSVGDGMIFGGTFATKPDATKIAPHFKTVESDTKWNVIVDEDNAAATVGKIKYGTVADALEAAVDGDTVTLLADSAESGLRVKDNKSVTLDLGDYDLTNASGNTINQYGGGTLTIKGTVNSQICGTVRTSVTKVVFGTEFAGKVEEVKVAETGSFSVSGGNFKKIINAIYSWSTSEVNPTNYLVKGYTYETVDGYYHIIPITEDNAVASATVNDETSYYMTLGEALEAAKAGGTVTLLKDKDSSNSDFGFNYYATGDVTLDLNGHRWSLSSPSSSSSPAIRLYSGNLTVKTSVANGGIYSSWGDIFDLRGGNLTIENGDFSGDGTIDTIVSSEFSGTVTIKDGTFGSISLDKNCTGLTINGGTFHGTVQTAYNSTTPVTITGGTFNGQVNCNQSSTGTFTISGGTFNGYVGNGGTFTITGGQFDTSKLLTNSNTTFEVSGGVFTADPTTGNNVTLAAGYEVLGNPDSATKAAYPYTVAKAVAQIGNVRYASLAAAVAAVPTTNVETTITMLADETIPSNAGVVIAATKNVVLDLNGCTISNSVTESGSSSVITNYGTLTIQDSTDKNANGTGTGLLTNAVADGTAGDYWSTPRKNYTSNVITNSGTLTVESGKIKNMAAGNICYCVDNQSNGTLYTPYLTVNGGWLYNDYTCAIRAYCNSTTNMNTVEINGGIVEGYSAIWFQNPNSYNNKGTFIVTGGKIKTTDEDVVAGTISLAESDSETYMNSKTTEFYATITGGVFNDNFGFYGANPENIVITNANDGTGPVFNGYISSTPEGYITGGYYKDTEVTVPEGWEYAGWMWPAAMNAWVAENADELEVNATTAEGYIALGEDSAKTTGYKLESAYSGYYYRIYEWTEEYTYHTFNGSDSFDSLLDEGYKLFATVESDPNYAADVYKVVKVVASITKGDTTTYYATFDDAIAAANATTDGTEQTITLLDSCATAADHDFETNPLVLTAANTTLDLNGKELTVMDNFTFIIAGNDDEVRNGTITAADNSKKACGYQTFPLVLASQKKGTQVTGIKVTDVTMKGGISVGGSYENNVACYQGGAEATITNCNVISGSSAAIYAQCGSTATIVSGKYAKHAKAYNPVLSAESGSAITVTGGIFSETPNAAYLATGYAVTANTDADTKAAYPFAVAKAVASITKGDTTTYYVTLADAVEGAVSGDTIVLLEDVSIDYMVYVLGKSVDFNLNNHTITQTVDNTADGTYTYGIVYDGCVNSDDDERTHGKVYGGTIITTQYGIYAADHTDVVVENVTVKQAKTKDSSLSFKHTALAASFDAVLTVNSGTFTGEYAASVFTSGGKIIINDGTFTGSEKAFYVCAPTNDDSEADCSIVVNGGKIKGDFFVSAEAGSNGYTASLEIKGGVYSVSPDSKYLATGKSVIANTDSATKAVYPFALGTKAADIVIKDKDQATEVKVDVDTTVDYSVHVATADNVTIPTEVQTQIKNKTVVEGVALEPEKTVTFEDETVTGVQAVVNAAKAQAVTDKNINFTKAIAASTETSTTVTVKVDVQVKPVAYTAEINSNSVKFDLNPIATVTVKNGDATAVTQQVEVTNEMIDTAQDIKVELYAGFQPAYLIHRADDNSVIDIYYPVDGDNNPADCKTFTYDAGTGVATAIVHHFSSMEAVDEADVVVTVAKIGDAEYESLADAIAAVANNGTIVLLAENSESVTVNVAKSFTIDAGSFTFSGSLTAGTGLTKTVSDNTYTFAETKYTVTLTSAITETTTTIADVSGGGEIGAATGTTISAPNVSGYRFVGWYTEYTTSDNGTQVSNANVYTFKPTADVSLTAVYEVYDGATFNLTVNSDNFTVNGEKQYSQYQDDVASGTSVTIAYTGSDTFLYWRNGSKALVTTETSFTTTLVANTEFTAVTATDVGGSAMVVFKNLKEGGQQLSTKRYTSTGTISFPSNPSYYGRTFTGWKVEDAGGNEIDATQESIQNLIADGATYLVVYGHFETTTKYEVTVHYMKDDTELTKYADTKKWDSGTLVTVNTGTAIGYSFSHWSIGDDIVSTNESYSFMPEGDVDIYCHLVKNNSAATKINRVVLDGATASSESGKYKITLKSTYSISNGTIAKAGFLYSTSDSDELTYDEYEAELIKCYAWDKTTDNTGSGSMVLNISTKSEDKTIYYRPFVLLTSGEVLYGDSGSGSYNSLT